MKKIILIVWASLSLLCVSCLNIEEEITLNADGSGVYEMRMDLKEALSMIIEMVPDSVKNNMTADQLLDSIANSQGAMDQMESALDALNEKDGISNAIQELSDGVFTMKFNFRDAESLTSSFTEGSGFENPLGLSPASYSAKKGLFVREQSIDDVEMDDEMEQAMQMMEMMMADATYTTIYNFPGKVKKSSNEEASWSNGKKTLTVKASFLDVLEDPSILNNTIKYKRK